MDQHLFDAAKVAAGVEEVKDHARKGIDAIHKVLTESELGTPERIENLEEGNAPFHVFAFTYGPLRGSIRAQQRGLVRPFFDIKIDKHEQWEGLPYLVRSARFRDDEGTPVLIKDVMGFLDDTLEKHVPTKSAAKQ